MLDPDRKDGKPQFTDKIRPIPPLADAANSVKNPPLPMLNSLENSKFTGQLAHFYPAEPQKKHIRVWSKVRGSYPVLKTKDLTKYTSSIPLLTNGERVIMVETWTDYQPKYGDGIDYVRGTGLDPIEFSTRVFISPRFATTVCWNNTAEVTKQKC